MRTSELLKILKEHGFVVLREGGNHTIYYNPKTGVQFPVSRHAKEVATGTVNKILKLAGIK